jgi:hypothetical protein
MKKSERLELNKSTRQSRRTRESPEEFVKEAGEERMIVEQDKSLPSGFSFNSSSLPPPIPVGTQSIGRKYQQPIVQRDRDPAMLRLIENEKERMGLKRSSSRSRSRSRSRGGALRRKSKKQPKKRKNKTKKYKQI